MRARPFRPWSFRPAAVGAAVWLVAASVPQAALADARSDARGHFKQGMEAIAAGKYKDGIVDLEKAYEILPHPNVLFNIARANALAGDLDAALRYYRRYLDDNPADKETVEATVRDLELQLARSRPAVVAPPVVEPAKDPPPTKLPDNSARPGPGDVGKKPDEKAPEKGIEKKSDVPVKAPEAKDDDVFAETLVTATKVAQSPLDAPNSTSIVTEQDIQLSGITKIPELLRRLAGVDLMEVTGGQTEVSLRGFNQRLSNRTLVLVDGRSVYSDMLGATLWQTLSIGVEDIARIEVVRGPGSALYGAVASGGVINIITKDPAEGKHGGARFGGGEFGMLHASTFAAGRSGALSYRAAAGYDYLPRWSREVPPGRADVRLGSRDQNASARTERFDLRTKYAIGKDTAVALGGGFSQGSLEVLGLGPLNDLVLPSFQNTDLTASFTSKHVEARAFWTRLLAETSLNAATVGQSLLPTRADQNVINGDLTLREAFDTGKIARHDFIGGAQYRLKDIAWTFLDGRRSEHLYSAFAHDDIRFSKRFSVVLDYRVDWVPYLSAAVQSPRGTILIHPSKASTFRATVGTAFRPPTFLESYLQVPIQLPTTGGSLLTEGKRSEDQAFRLKAEGTLNAEIGYLNQENDHFNIDVSLYYNRVKDLIQLASARPVTLGDVAAGTGSVDRSSALFPIFFGGFANQCQRYNVYGGEVGVRSAPIEGLDFYGNYTFNLLREDFSGCSAVERADALSDDRTSMHKVNLGTQLRTKFGIDGSIDFHAVTKQSWAERTVSGTSVATNVFPLGGWQIVNAKLGYHFAKNHAEISAVGFNLLDMRHREHPFGQLVGRRMMAMFAYNF
jgi:outer membrane receptor for ferrienterochelin and colicin